MHTMNDIKMIDFQRIGDKRGKLVIAESGKQIPFDVKRIFYIYGSANDVVRGQHANRVSEFVLVNVAGTSKVKVRDGEGNEAVYFLNRPYMAIYLPTMVWKEMFDFSADSVLLVLTNTLYDPDEYIRDYQQYEEEISKGICESDA